MNSRPLAALQAGGGGDLQSLRGKPGCIQGLGADVPCLNPIDLAITNQRVQ